MGSMNLRRSLVSVAVAAAFGLAGGPAGAVVYVGEFDPPDSFSGNFLIRVDDDCLSGTGFHGNAGIAFNPNDGICTVELTSASALVTSNVPVYTGNLTFAPPVITDPNVLFGVNIGFGNNGYTLDSLDTALIHHVGANPYTGDDWWLQFRSGQIDLCFPNCPPPPPPCDPYCIQAADAPDAPTFLDRGVYLYVGGQPTPGNFSQFAQYTRIDIVPPGGVPEPGTLALILGALGGGWFARRRKKPKPAD